MVAWRPIDQSSRDPCAESSPVRIDQQPQPHREPRGRSISSPSKSVVNSGDLPCTAKRYDHRAQAFVAAKATIERQAKGEVKHPKVSGLARERASERASGRADVDGNTQLQRREKVTLAVSTLSQTAESTLSCDSYTAHDILDVSRHHLQNNTHGKAHRVTRPRCRARKKSDSSLLRCRNVSITRSRVE